MTLLSEATTLCAMNTKLSTDGQKKPLSRDDLMRVRGMCLLNGVSLCQWLRYKGFSTDTAFNALLGRRSGPVSRRIREAVSEEFGI